MDSRGTFLVVLGMVLLGLSCYLWTGDDQVAHYAIAPGTMVAGVRPSSLIIPTRAFQPHVPQPLAGYGVPWSKAMPHTLAPLASSADGAVASKGTIVIIGATGGTGSEVAWQALARGYKVLGIAREPMRMSIPPGSGLASGEAGLPFKSPDMTIIRGSVLNMGDLKQAFEADDIAGVVVCLGGKTESVGKTMLTFGTLNVIEVMKAKGLKRISVISSVGVGDSASQTPLIKKMMQATVMRDMFADKEGQEKLFLQGPGADLEWTIVRPAGMCFDAPTGQINIVKSGLADGLIARADVAAFCLDAVINPEWQYIRKTPTIISPIDTTWNDDDYSRGAVRPVSTPLSEAGSSPVDPFERFG